MRQVTKASGSAGRLRGWRGTDRHIVYKRSLTTLAKHSGFLPSACQPYRAKRKGKVERPFPRFHKDFFLTRSFGASARGAARLARHGDECEPAWHDTADRVGALCSPALVVAAIRVGGSELFALIGQPALDTGTLTAPHVPLRSDRVPNQRGIRRFVPDQSVRVGRRIWPARVLQLCSSALNSARHRSALEREVW